MTTYGYTRVSTTEQAADGTTSLATQERVVRGFSLAAGAIDIQIFTDAGVSGSTVFEQRPSGKALSDKLRRGDVLYVAKMDRLFRSALNALVMAKAFQKRGVDLVLCDLGAEPITQNGSSKFFFTVMAAAAEFDRDRIAERMAEGRKGKAARGGHTGGIAPYGLKIIGGGRSSTLECVPSEQATIAAARQYAAGLSLRALSKTLAAAGHFNRAGRPFDPKQLSRILKQNPPAGVAPPLLKSSLDIPSSPIA